MPLAYTYSLYFDMIHPIWRGFFFSKRKPYHWRLQCFRDKIEISFLNWIARYPWKSCKQSIPIPHAQHVSSSLDPHSSNKPHEKFRCLFLFGRFCTWKCYIRVIFEQYTKQVCQYLRVERPSGKDEWVRFNVLKKVGVKKTITLMLAIHLVTNQD